MLRFTAHISLSSILVIVLASIITYGCSPVSKKEAALIITEDEEFSKPVGFLLEIGRVSQGDISIFDFPKWENTYVKTWKNLESLGYIKLKHLGRVTSNYRRSLMPLAWDTYVITLTQKAQEFIISKKKMFGKNFCELEVCKRKLIRIIAISKRSATVVYVKYSWGYDSFNPIFDAVQPLATDMQRYKVYEEERLLRKIGDKWRVAPLLR